MSVLLICGLENERGVAVFLFVFLVWRRCVSLILSPCLGYSWATALLGVVV